MASYRTNGVPPKPEAKRRRRNKPASYGAAANGAHPLVQDMWNTVQHSCEAAFYSETDWERLRLELWFANHTMASGRPSDQAWAAIQHGLNELLLSPAVKRRGGIELKRAVDVDEYAAVSMVGGYRQALKSV
jgi:hypothetical protein